MSYEQVFQTVRHVTESVLAISTIGDIEPVFGARVGMRLVDKSDAQCLWGNIGGR